MKLLLGQRLISGIVAAFAGVALLAVPAGAQTPSPSPSPISMSQIPEHPEHPVVVE